MLALPVKLSIAIRSSATSCAATSFEHGKTLIAPSGHPESRMARPSHNAVIGVWGAGFMMMGFPDAIAGASLCATRLMGKLNGVIPRIGPNGNLRDKAIRPFVPGV